MPASRCIRSKYPGNRPMSDGIPIIWQKDPDEVDLWGGFLDLKHRFTIKGIPNRVGWAVYAIGETTVHGLDEYALLENAQLACQEYKNNPEEFWWREEGTGDGGIVWQAWAFGGLLRYFVCQGFGGPEFFWGIDSGGSRQFDLLPTIEDANGDETNWRFTNTLEQAFKAARQDYRERMSHG